MPRFFQNVALDFQLPVFAAQPAQLLALGGRGRSRAFAAIRLRLEEPVANGLFGRFELGGQFLLGSSRTSQGDDMLTIGLRVRYRTTGLGVSSSLHREYGSTKPGQLHTLLCDVHQ